MKKEIFNIELGYIVNSRIREIAEKLMDGVPDYFFEIPASSTGKYHPSFAQGDGGLVRHTKVVVRFGHEMLNSNDTLGKSYNQDEKDLMLLAMMLHDTFKCGVEKSKYTLDKHPIIAAEYVNERKEELGLSEQEVYILTSSISSHMGQWNKCNFGKEFLPLPENKYQKIVHLCDYLASKKFIEVNFDENNNLID